VGVRTDSCVDDGRHDDRIDGRGCATLCAAYQRTRYLAAVEVDVLSVVMQPGGERDRVHLLSAYGEKFVSILLHA
jgi:hypothetical protein